MLFPMIKDLSLLYARVTGTEHEIPCVFIPCALEKYIRGGFKLACEIFLFKH